MDEEVEEVVKEVEVTEEVSDIEVSEAEETALMSGWVPQEDFRGPAELWKSAEEFNEFGEQHAAVARERSKKVVEDNRRMSREMEGLKRGMTQLIKNQKNNTDIAVKDGIKRALEKRDEAIEVGDIDAVHAHDKEIDRLKAEATKDEIIEPTEEFNEWKDENPWYNSDTDMSADADILGKQLIDTGRYKTDKALFAAVLRKIKVMYPDKFEQTNTRKSKPAAVSSPRKAATKTDGSGFKDIPLEDRQAYKQQQMLMPEGALLTEADFAKAYFEQ